MSVVARDVGDVKDALRAHRSLLPRAGGSKTGLSEPESGSIPLDISALCGVIEHLPQEFTLTARAATPVAEAAELLAAAGQYLPFDPMLARAGSTLGGTVAAGISGPGRVRYGGVRDFILGVTVVDGSGTEIRGGGKVVKNAAGFDLPKLMVGSLGALGVVTEITFKVFPAPEARATVRADREGVAGAVALLLELQRSPVELEAAEIDGSGTLWARIAGRSDVLQQRVDRLCGCLGDGCEVADVEAAAFWDEALELGWMREGDTAVRVPLTPGRVAPLDERLPTSVRRRFSGAGQLAWIGWPAEAGSLAELGSILTAMGLTGLRVRGGDGSRLIGAEGPVDVVARTRSALDPEGRWAELR